WVRQVVLNRLAAESLPELRLAGQLQLLLPNQPPHLRRYRLGDSGERDRGAGGLFVGQELQVPDRVGAVCCVALCETELAVIAPRRAHAVSLTRVGRTRLGRRRRATEVDERFRHRWRIRSPNLYLVSLYAMHAWYAMYGMSMVAASGPTPRVAVVLSR